ncbi:hypothetical protein [Pseudoxanthomonas koreensis]|uniref:hypothetical protein n=1 Tax=Pseudoxanthomonas koreensis TaxID=266061 RepID=UPI0013907B2D|nr:hypothetical protein [Pseudoxanthomonas koreensis]
MSRSLPTGTENFPPGWECFDHYVSHVGARSLGFAVDGGGVNRFAARYRAAKSFNRAEFDHLSAPTRDGYSTLIRLLLTYSAFEHFLRCIGTEIRHTSTLLTESERDTALGRLRALNGSQEFFSAVRSHLDQRNYTRQFDEFLAGNTCNLFYLAGGVRHAFAHGQLTASPATCPPESVATCSRFLVNLLVRIMDREFKRRMDEFEEAIAPPPGPDYDE